MSTGRAILFGTLAVGVLDGLYACGLSASRGGTPVRVFQSVASGLLGRDAARAGGYGTALLGLLLHFFIASVVFTVFLLASRKLGVLTRDCQPEAAATATARRVSLVEPLEKGGQLVG